MNKKIRFFDGWTIIMLVLCIAGIVFALLPVSSITVASIGEAIWALATGLWVVTWRAEVVSHQRDEQFNEDQVAALAEERDIYRNQALAAEEKYEKLQKAKAVSDEQLHQTQNKVIVLERQLNQADIKNSAEPAAVAKSQKPKNRVKKSTKDIKAELQGKKPEQSK